MGRSVPLFSPDGQAGPISQAAIKRKPSEVVPWPWRCHRQPWTHKLPNPRPSALAGSGAQVPAASGLFLQLEAGF
jgi:hypothetical protein